jgi:hypothetical protein
LVEPKGSEAYRLGFDEREYSYSPTGFPTAVCAYVVDREIWRFQSLRTRVSTTCALTASITAPVTGSCGLPACTARVPNLCVGVGARGGVSIECSGSVIVNNSSDSGSWQKYCTRKKHRKKLLRRKI